MKRHVRFCLLAAVLVIIMAAGGYLLYQRDEPPESVIEMASSPLRADVTENVIQTADVPNEAVAVPPTALTVKGRVLDARTGAPLQVFEVGLVEPLGLCRKTNLTNDQEAKTDRNVASPFGGAGAFVASEDFKTLRQGDHISEIRRDWHQIADWQPVNSPTGAFEISGVKPGYVWAVAARARSYAPNYVLASVPDNAEAEPVIIRLERESVVEGRVLNTWGDPIHDAQIAYKERGEENPLARSNMNGFYRVNAMPISRYTFIASHPDFISSESQLHLMPGSYGRLDFTLVRGAAIEGYIRKGNEPLTGVSVSQVKVRELGKTDDQGYYQLRNMFPGEYALKVDTRDERTGAILELTRTVIVAEGERVRVDMVFPEELATLHGRITANGMQIDSALVDVAIDTGTGLQTSASPRVEPLITHIDEHGHYELNNLMPGLLRARIVAGMTDGSKRVAFFHINIAEGEHAWHDVTFAANPGRLAGTLSGITPGEKWAVLLLPEWVDEEYFRLADADHFNSMDYGHTHTHISDDGHFLIEAIEPGNYNLAAIPLPDPHEQDNIAEYLSRTQIIWQSIAISDGEENTVALSARRL